MTTKTTDQSATAFIVSYRVDEDGVACTNIALGSYRAVYAHYENCAWSYIRDASDSEIEALRAKGCPVVECEEPEGPAITFDTTEEYEAQCDRCTEYGIDLAARKIWEAIKEDMEASWAKEEELRGYGCAEGNKAAKRTNLQAKRRLDAYTNAMKAIGYDLKVQVDPFDECKHIFDVVAFNTSENFTIGCIRSYSKANW